MPPFTYSRRVQFAETDMAGIVHFSTFFRYMEEAEHALWRAAGLTIAAPGDDTVWPRVAASFDFRAPLHFEEEFVVEVRIGEVKRATFTYAFTVRRGETDVGSGTMTVAFVTRRPGEPMKAVALPMATIDRLRACTA